MRRISSIVKTIPMVTKEKEESARSHDAGRPVAPEFDHKTEKDGDDCTTAETRDCRFRCSSGWLCVLVLVVANILAIIMAAILLTVFLRDGQASNDSKPSHTPEPAPAAFTNHPAPMALPNATAAPVMPCSKDPRCSFVNGSIDPVLPPDTVVMIDIPGTFQNPAPMALPNATAAPVMTCSKDPRCSFVHGSIDPVFPPDTVVMIDIPGTCQNWAREWMRTGMNATEYSAERIRQRFALAMMYCEGEGDNWVENDLWLSDLHECDWMTSVEFDPCNQDEEYLIIRNDRQQMTGTLPSELSMIPTLREISLSDNMLEGGIPNQWDALQDLSTLVLSFNFLSGTLPGFRFHDLVHLDLAHNNFTGTIPYNVLLEQPLMLDLFLEHNSFYGSIPTDFGYMRWRRLHLNDNEFSGTIPVNLIRFNTEEVYLHNNQFTGTLPASEIADILGDSAALEGLTIYGTSVTGNGEPICDLNLPNLTQFAVDLSSTICGCCVAG